MSHWSPDWDGSDDARDSEMMSRNVSRVMSWRDACNMWRSESWDDGIIGMCWLPLHMPSLSIGESPETMRWWGEWACVHPVTIIGRCVTRDGHAHTSHYMSRKLPQKLTSVHFRIKLTQMLNLSGSLFILSYLLECIYNKYTDNWNTNFVHQNH